MSELCLHVMCGKKRRSTSSRFTPTIREGIFIVGELIATKGENGIVAAKTSRGLELFDIKLSGGRWFTQREGTICLDQTLPFSRVDLREGDLICFERPLDSIDRILHWGFGVNLATLMVDDLVSSDWKELDILADEVNEFASLFVDEDGKITPEGPSEAWNDILTNRMHWTVPRLVA